MRDSFSRDVVNQLKDNGIADPRDAEIARLTAEVYRLQVIRKNIGDMAMLYLKKCNEAEARVRLAEADAERLADALIARIETEVDEAIATYTQRVNASKGGHPMTDKKHSYDWDAMGFYPDEDVCEAFPWSRTPQGFDWWTDNKDTPEGKAEFARMKRLYAEDMAEKENTQ